MLLQKRECWFFDTGEQKTGVDVVWFLTGGLWEHCPLEQASSAAAAAAHHMVLISH